MINYWALLRPQQNMQHPQPPSLPPCLPAPLFITSLTIFMAFLRASAPGLIQPAQLALKGRLQLPELQKGWEKGWEKLKTQSPKRKKQHLEVK